MPITEVTLLTDIKSDIGEVQVNPTQYTVLDRLKTIASNSSVNNLNRFNVNTELRRPNNSIPYSIGDIINNGTDTTMPYFDFTPYNILNRTVSIDEINIISNLSPLAGTDNLRLSFWDSPILGIVTFADNDVFNPSYTDMGGRLDKVEIGTPLSVYNVYYKKVILATEGPILFKLVGNFLYFTLNQFTATTPSAFTKYNIVLKGTIN